MTLVQGTAKIEIEVRDAAQGDLAGCHRCLDDVAREGRWLSRMQAPPIERYETFWNELQQLKAPQVVALDRDVVGWCDVTPNASPGREHIGTLGMGVVANYRRLGLGRRLLTLALQRARERHLEQIQLSVLHDNHPARALYENAGFLIEGRRTQDWGSNGIIRNSVLMAIDLRSSEAKTWQYRTQD